MKISITVRHTDVPDELKARASELLDKLAKKAHRPQRAKIIFDADHGECIVEIELRLARNQARVAKAAASDFRTALDLVIAKLAHQLDRGTTSAVRE